MNGCPPAEDLEQLLADQLSPEMEAALEAHVGQCAACQRWLDKRTDPMATRPGGMIGTVGAPGDAGEGTPLPASLLKQIDSSAASRETPAPPLTVVDVARKNPFMAEAAVPGYEILGCLGSGGAGVVFRAMHLGLGRVVALKRIQEQGEPSLEQRERFRREAGALAKLHHPNIVQVYDVGEYADRPYLAMEFVEGGSLAARTSGTPQRSETAALIVEALARGVDHAHQRGLIHRDLKPANVLLHWLDEVPDRPSCEGCIPKVTDFGLVKDLNQGPGLTQTRDILGTPSYMAPEQAQGSGSAVGPLVDVWALGAILYELLTCRPPFNGESVLDTLLQVRFNEPVRPARLQPKVPRALETICLKCLEKEPAKRYASAAALADDLRRHLDGRPIQAQPPSVFSRVWDARTLRRIGPPFPHTRRVSDVAFSPDGSMVLTATQDGIARLWDLASRKPVGEPMRHAATIRRAAFSPDSRRIVTASHDGTARIWDVATGRSLGMPLRHAAAVKAVAFSPDGRHILTGDADGLAWLWDAPPAALAGNPEQLKLWVQVITGQELAEEDDQVHLLDFSTWDRRRQRLFELGFPK
jgi:serine/threonine protein kinase